MESVNVEEWGDDGDESSVTPEKRSKVSEQDVFKFAQRILIVLAVIFLVVAVITMTVDNPAVDGVWTFTSAALNSIASMVIAFYFAKK